MVVLVFFYSYGIENGKKHTATKYNRIFILFHFYSSTIISAHGIALVITAVMFYLYLQLADLVTNICQTYISSMLFICIIIVFYSI